MLILLIIDPVAHAQRLRQQRPMRNNPHPWKGGDPAAPSETRVIKVEFFLLLTLISFGLIASLLSAIESLLSAIGIR
jgi:hypothetical protein